MATFTLDGAAQVSQVEPLDDRVLLQRLDPGEIVVGSIVIPETATDPPQQARVVAVGPGRSADDGSRVQMTVSVGDTVLISKWAGIDVKIDQETYVLVREDDILARVKGVS